MLYVAVRPDGGRRLGVRRVRDRRQLAEQLRRERLVPTRTWSLPNWAAAPDRKISLKDLAALNTQIAQLLSRGVPLVETLDVVARTVSARVRGRVERIRELVAGGSSFADACQNVGGFDTVTVSVYRAAERTGDLAGAAKQLASTARRQLAVSGKAATLMIYPAIVMTISVLVSVGMLTIIVPRIASSLKGAGVKIPAITQIVVGAGEFLRDNAMFLGIGVLGLVVVGIVMRRRIAAFLNLMMRRLPLMRDVVLAQESARFFAVMAAMTRSGVVLADALGVAVNVISHPTLSAELIKLRTRLVEGGVLKQLIEGVTSLPLPTRRLLIAAERSGDLQSSFETLAQDMADEVETRSSRLLAVLEPLLIVIMFFMIGSLLLSIMIPLIQATARGVG